MRFDRQAASRGSRARRARIAIVIGAVLGAIAPIGGASAFKIVPISEDFDPSGRDTNRTFQVENERDVPVSISIAMVKRTVDLDGKETLKDTDEFVVFPTEIILPPKASRAVRVKWAGDPAPAAELAYRIIAEETPLAQKRDATNAGVSLTVRYEGSIYIVPRGTRQNVVVASARPVAGTQGSRQLEVVLENKGTRHAILDQPSLTLTAGGASVAVDKAITAKTMGGENLLAGSKRRFLLPWPAGLAADAVTGELKYTAQ
jgi:fimbrial chaperone protein